MFGAAGIASTLGMARGPPAGWVEDAVGSRRRPVHEDGDDCAASRRPEGAASVIRGLSAAQVATTGTVLADAPPMGAEELVNGRSLAHLDEHFGSIRRTVGHN